MNKTLFCLLLIFLFLFCIKYSNAEKIKIGFIEEIDSSVPVPEFIKKNLIDSIRQKLVDTEKFEIVDRSEKDLHRLFEEMKFSDERVGRVDITDEKKAKYGKIAGIEYIAFVKINDFFRGLEKSKFQTISPQDKSVVRLGVNFKLVNTSTGRIKLEKNINSKKYSSVATENIDVELINKVINSLSYKIVQNIMDELSPIYVMKRTGNTVFVNRGEKCGLKTGDVLEVFAVKKMIDENSLEEVELTYSVGEIKVTNVFDKTSEAEIIEDFGVTKGCIAKIYDTEESAERIKKDLDKKINAEDW